MDLHSRHNAFLNPLALISRIFSPDINISGSNRPNAILPVDRRQVYKLLDAYYNNTQYNREIWHGSLDYINRELGEAAARDLAGIFNPIERGTELYAQNIFAGSFGDEIVVDDVVGPKNKPRPINQKIIDPLEQIWDWSNFNSGEKERYPRIGSLFGTVGIRVVARVGKKFPNDDPKERIVYIQFEHPSIIEDYVKNQQQEITQILTIHFELEGDIDINTSQTRQFNTYKTLMTETQFETLRNNEPFNEVVDDIDYEFATTANTLGKVPYVLNFHRKLEGPWGAWWFMGSENPIDRLNSLIAHINRQIIRHVKVKWVMASKGNPPREFNFSDTSVLFIKLLPEQTGNDTFIKPLVADLNLGDAISEAKFMLAELRDRMPELKAIDGDFLSNTTGQTVAQLRIPAIDRLKVARSNYESNLIKAQKLALAYGVLLGIWDVGTGAGTIEAVNEASEKRLFDHKFIKREYLTVTESERLQNQLLEMQIAEAGNVAGATSNGTGANNKGPRNLPDGRGSIGQLPGSNQNPTATP
jgi:hypothetical protein